MKRKPMPFLAISNGEIEALPPIGTTVLCWKCGKRHRPHRGTTNDGTPSSVWFFYCGSATYLCGINGKEWRPRKERDNAQSNA